MSCIILKKTFPFDYVHDPFISLFLLSPSFLCPWLHNLGTTININFMSRHMKTPLRTLYCHVLLVWELPPGLIFFFFFVDPAGHRPARGVSGTWRTSKDPWPGPVEPVQPAKLELCVCFHNAVNRRRRDLALIQFVCIQMQTRCQFN